MSGDPFNFDLRDWKTAAYLEFSTLRPTSHVLITGLTDCAEAPPWIPEWWEVEGHQTVPLWTRHMLGVREAERDARRRAKLTPKRHPPSR